MTDYRELSVSRIIAIKAVMREARQAKIPAKIFKAITTDGEYVCAYLSVQNEKNEEDTIVFSHKYVVWQVYDNMHADNVLFIGEEPV